MKHTNLSKTTATLFGVLLAIQLFSQSSEKDYTQDVNPIIGTKGILIYGRTTPFVTPPFGMTQWTALNFKFRVGLPMYNYAWHKIVGFRGSHKPAMCMGDYGYFSIMPVAGAKAKNKPNHSAWFSHRHEISKPYYYSVQLNRSLPRKKVDVEMTSTVRTGLFRISFPKKTEHHIFIEAAHGGSGGWVKIDPAKNEVSGYNTDIHSQDISPRLPNFHGYFVIQFNSPITGYSTWSHDTMIDKGTQQAGTYCGARVSFGPDTVMVKIGTSFISLEQARENMDKEIPQWDFAKVEDESHKEWNKYLSRIDIESIKPGDRTIFYTGLYHSLLFPRQFSEYGRYYSAFDDKIHNGVSYNDYSLWDTYRAEHPLLIFLTPELVPGMVQFFCKCTRKAVTCLNGPTPVIPVS